MATRSSSAELLLTMVTSRESAACMLAAGFWQTNVDQINKEGALTF
jgi:hypothetical protein